MSEAALDNVIQAQKKLIAALDAQDVDAISAASEELAALLDVLRVDGAWYATSSARYKIEFALKQTNAARMRVNYLSNWTRQKIEMLFSLRLEDGLSLYKKPIKTSL
jgi:hypothetical protein